MQVFVVGVRRSLAAGCHKRSPSRTPYLPNMRDDQRITRLPRRYFLGRSGLALLGGVAFTTSRVMVAGDSKPNPFAYDISRFTKTDPRLIGYETVRLFTAEVSEPNRIAVDRNRRIYVAAAKGVSVYDETGGSVLNVVLPKPARCVAIGAEGRIYVGMRDRIAVFDADGKENTQWDPVAGNAWLTGIAVTNDAVFVADSGNRLIWRHDLAGKVECQIGKKDRNRNVPGIVLPSPFLDVTVGVDGLLRVNNPGRHVVEVYTQDGDLELSWGKPSAGIEGFCGCCNPIGLSALPDGRYVTCEKGLPRAKVYSAAGDFDCVVAGPELFPGNAESGSRQNKAEGRYGGMDAATDAEGRVYVLDLVSSVVRILRPKV